MNHSTFNPQWPRATFTPHTQMQSSPNQSITISPSFSINSLNLFCNSAFTMNHEPLFFTVSISFHAIASGRTGCNCNCHCYLFVFLLRLLFFFIVDNETIPFLLYRFKISVFIQIKQAGAHMHQPYIIACWTYNLIPTFKHSRTQAFTHSNNHTLTDSNIQTFKHSNIQAFKHSRTLTFTHSHIH